MKTQVIFTVVLYIIVIVFTFYIFSGSFGAVFLLKAGLPFATSIEARFGNKLLIALAMPALSGQWGSYTGIMEKGWNEYFYYRKGKTIAQAKGYGDEFAKILASVMEDEKFKPVKGYPVIETNLHPTDSSAYLKWENVYIRNQSEQTPDPNSLMREKLLFSKSEGPLVLIYHTHTSEAYNTTGEFYNEDSSTHSTDNEENTVAVGEAFCDALKALGIESVHCTERLDTSYNDAYDVSYEILKEYLEKYPSVQIVIDMHRDSIVDEDNNKYRPVAEIQGIKCAQLMPVVGMSTYTENEFKEQNFSFAVNLANVLETNYPGITRTVMLKNSTFNQELCANSVLIEMGASGNTLTEAKRSAVFLASAVAQLFYENQGELNEEF